MTAPASEVVIFIAARVDLSDDGRRARLVEQLLAEVTEVPRERVKIVWGSTTLWPT